ncbi:MAG: hypothetical protein AAGE80_14980 [Pseudomonadota bacterium]
MTSSSRKATDANSIMFDAQSLYALVELCDGTTISTQNHFLFRGQFIASPVLLSFAMELALKAWWVRENVSRDVPKTHNLLKLFNGLSDETRGRLESAHPEIPNMHKALAPVRRGLKSLLEANQSKFVEWRYLYEMSRGSFPTGEFSEALSAVFADWSEPLNH